MGIKFLNLKENKKYEKQIKKLFIKAFPKEERAPYIILKMLAKKEKANFCVIEDDEKFVGLIYNIFYKDIVYVFFFAIDDSLRGQGYGSIVLKELQNKYTKKRIILMIEEIDEKSDNYKERVKRKEFYEKNGFKDFNYKIKEMGVIYQMLGCSEKVSKEEYLELMKNYFGKFLFKMVYERINK